MTTPPEPKKPRNKRTEKIEIRLFPDELAILRERYDQENGKPFSTTIRTYLLESELPPRRQIPDPETLRALGYVGNNLNQIAHRLNATKGRAFDKIEILRDLCELRELVEGLRDDR